MAPLKRGENRSGWHGHKLYPWLKCHGSIEARPRGLGQRGSRKLSMAKMPWLH